jgi:hypothetical protein
MSFIQSVKLAEYKAGSVRSPVARRREKLAFKVDEQIKLAIDSTYRPTKIVWSRSADGTEHKVEQPKRIKRWWVEAADGTVQLTVRYGAKPLELAKGKNAIALNSKDEIEGTLRKLQLAVLSGELDAILEQQIGLTKPIAK